MVTVYVPATSANVGAGFDTTGLALGMGNTVIMSEAEGCHIVSLDGQPVPTSTDNLIYRAAETVYQKCGKPLSGLFIQQTSPIPMARGLGSSSACIVAGLVGANALLGEPLSRHELLNIAAEMEGHPDNVAPALLGGLVVSCIQNGKVHSVKKDVTPILKFGVFIPDFELYTEQARAALPETVPHKDAVYNLSRAALCQAALCEGRLDLLGVITGDKLHQPYRAPLIPGAEDVMRIAMAAGASATYISGAGPTIVAIVEPRHQSFWVMIERTFEDEKKHGRPAGRFRPLCLNADNYGARLI